MPEIRECTLNFDRSLCGVNVTLDPQQNLGSESDRVLLIGQIASDGTLPTCVPLKYSDIDTDTLGVGSMLGASANEFLEKAPRGELYIFALPNEGNAGSADITFSGVDMASFAGIVYLFVNGRAFAVNFDPVSETNADLASKFAAVIDAETPGLTTTVSGDTLTITTLSNGVIGGWLDVRTSYSLRADLISSPEITSTIVNTPATGSPSLSCIEGITEGYEFIINPYTDDDSIASISNYACGQWSGGARTKVYGVLHGTSIQGQTFANNLNNAFFAYQTINGAFEPPAITSACFGAQAYDRLRCDSGRVAESLTGVALNGLTAPEPADQFNVSQSGDLVQAGMGYFNVTRNNTVTIGRAVTTFTTRNNGTLDDSLRDINKPAIMACISRFIQEQVEARFTGYAFRSDGIVGNTDTRVLTIEGLRSFIVGLGQQLSNLDMIQNVEGFIRSIIIQEDSDGCISVSVDPELVCGFCCLNINLRTI